MDIQNLNVQIQHGGGFKLAAHIYYEMLKRGWEHPSLSPHQVARDVRNLANGYGIVSVYGIELLELIETL